ncbi:MAG TPA: polyprenol phosphomannose-dependent alpha 1,6 mannosyltransferase MptB, partial [Acidimicrobiales bacterium]|nr:polyprenol phosphomannose-dependent alpha 1,6 mannosyltransferase MptB [Acidimicrobiales bacterium]
TLFHLIGGAHNDALMVGLLVAGLALAKEGRPIIGIVLCTLAAAIKAPAELAVIYIGWEWLGIRLPWRERIRPVVTAAMISGAIMAFISWATGLGWGWLGALSTPGTVVTMLSPTTLVGTIMGKIGNLFGLGASQHLMLSISRGLGLLVAFGACIVLLAMAEKLGSIRALGLSLLLVVMLGPVVQPWYLSWGLLLAAPVATGKLRKTVVVLSVAVCFLGLPGAKQLLAFLGHANVASVATAVGILLLVMTTPLKGWVRRLISLRVAATGAVAGAVASANGSAALATVPVQPGTEG